MRTYKPGCWGDGAFGHQYVRKRLAILVREFNDEIADKLLGEMTDDASEEDEALDLLNENTDQDRNGPVFYGAGSMLIDAWREILPYSLTHSGGCSSHGLHHGHHRIILEQK